MQPFDDVPALADLVDRLSACFEASAGSDWRFEHDDPRQRAQLRGIIGFRLQAERIEMKFKLNQNHPAANVAAVAQALDARGGDQARAVAALMRARGNANEALE